MDKKKDSKLSSFLSSKYNKAILIVVEIAILITIVVLICLVVKGDVSLKPAQTTKYVLTTINNEIEYKSPFLTESPKNDYTIGTTSGGVNVNNPASVNPDNNETVQDFVSPSAGSALADPSGWSQSKILATAADAVNKTKAYKGNLIVSHSESFTADVTECTGGDVVKSVANLMIGWIVKPVDENLSYSNGTAVNSEGETIPIILPIRNSFALTQGGMKSASINKSGNEYIIKIGIVKESVGMYEVPKHNAASIGYLDVGSLDLSLFTVDSADITYQGSSIELHVNAQGYVTYAKYSIPMQISGSAHRGSISGSATFNGEQTEIWKLNW